MNADNRIRQQRSRPSIHYSRIHAESRSRGGHCAIQVPARSIASNSQLMRDQMRSLLLDPDIFSAVIAGLDPAIQESRANAADFARRLDRRVKPGDDNVGEGGLAHK